VLGDFYFRSVEVVTVEPEEYKGFVIVEAPGKMFKATKIVPTAHFKRPFYACTIRSLKTSIDYALMKMKPVNKNKPVKNQD
jgi:hypothetical protein